MRNRLFFLSFFVCLWPMSFCFAQYGSGADGNRNDGCGLRYADSIRTHLTANASSGQAVVAVNDASAFSNGDLCLVIQMLGTGVGQYEERTISSISGNNITFTSNLTYAYAYTASTNIAQVIRIFQFSNVTLKTPGDQITCHAWDGFTGGVCYFKVSGTLDMDADGAITVAGKGYRGGSGGTLWISGEYGKPGSGGTNTSNNGKNAENINSNCAPASGGGGGGGGGTGASGNGGQGGNYIPSLDFATAINTPDPYPNPGGDGRNGANGSNGEGPGAGTASSAAANNSNSSHWGTASGYDLLMGGGGAQGKQGLASGRPSGGGGGAYGTGGNGTPGSCAVANDGVAGGNGGAGGGILVMLVNAIQGAGNISVAGGNGSDGATGLTGVTGGNGGTSGGGASRGGGGGGRGGTGGGGSCPGHGGAAGSLRVGCECGYTFFTNGGTKGAYGAGGVGGTGGTGANGGNAGNDGPDDGQGGPGGYGGWSADGCKGTAGDPSVSTNPGKQTGQAGGAGGVPGCNDDRYCLSFAGGSGVVVLPIELLSFTGFAKNQVNLLRWTTLTETNNDYFTLYRSEDAEHWHEISKIDGAGTSHMQRHYQYVDEVPLNDRINYYQLQQTDFDGKFSRSNIIAIVPKGKSSIYIAENEINVIISEASEFSYEIIGVAGSRVAGASSLDVQQGVFKINIADLAASVYLLRVQIGNKVESVKFVKR